MTIKTYYWYIDNMKKEKFFTKGIGVLIGVISFFILTIIVFLFLRLSSQASEWWTRHVTLPYLAFSGELSSRFSFSLTEVFFSILIVFCIVLITFTLIFFFKRRVKKALKILTFLSAVIIGVSSYYTVIISLSYHREPLDFIPQYEGEFSQDQFKDLLIYYTDKFNSAAEVLDFDEQGDVVSPYSLDELAEVLIDEYAKIETDYLSSYTGKIKPMFTSWLYRELQIIGVTFAPLSEANVNVLNTSMSIPFTAAHELAHQKGVMREEDANLLALYICLSSADPYLQFSGYIHSYTSIYGLLNYTGISEDKTEIYESLNSHILNAYSHQTQYWTEHDLLGNIAEFFNDLYLKLSGTAGTTTYIDTYVSQDTGETDGEGHPIYTFTFSPYQKLFFALYP